MKHFLLALIFTFSSFSIAKAIDSVKAEEEIKAEVPQNNPTGESKWYYGGNIGFSFWNDYYYFGVYPLVGYKITPQFSIGGKIGYSYIKDSRYEPAVNSSNYGGSIFSRYRIIPQIYLHAEYVYFSYGYSVDVQEKTFNTERVWVPYLLIGGGFSQNIGPNVWAFVEVLFDVIQDENSLYDEWEPFISFGVGVGF